MEMSSGTSSAMEAIPQGVQPNVPRMLCSRQGHAADTRIRVGEVTVGESSNAKRLRHIHPSKAEAEAAAKAEWQRIQRGNATLTDTLARGRPDLLPECTFSLLGIKPQIAAVRWLGVKVTHQMSDSGYTTGIEAESKLSESGD